MSLLYLERDLAELARAIEQVLHRPKPKKRRHQVPNHEITQGGKSPLAPRPSPLAPSPEPRAPSAIRKPKSKPSSAPPEPKPTSSSEHPMTEATPIAPARPRHWRKQCAARDLDTGSRCGLLVGHVPVEQHRGGRGVFIRLAPEGATQFPQATQITRAAEARSGWETT